MRCGGLPPCRSAETDDRSRSRRRCNSSPADSAHWLSSVAASSASYRPVSSLHTTPDQAYADEHATDITATDGTSCPDGGGHCVDDGGCGAQRWESHRCGTIDADRIRLQV